MKEFAKKSGVAVAETVAIIGQSVSKELARKVQPFGLTQKTGDKFQESIAKQIGKAARWGQYKPIEGQLKDVHSQVRDRSGAVKVKPPRQFQPKRKGFSKAEIEGNIRDKQRKAGLAKAGWIAAGESIDSPLLKTARGVTRKIKGVAQWIRRHVKGSSGSSKFVRKGGLNSTVFLTNSVDYAYSGNNSTKRTWQSAIADGYKRSITMVRARLKKLS
jgi:hypothetical protein